MSKCCHMTQWLAGRNLRLSILILFSEIPYLAKTGKKLDFNILISGFKETSFINSTFFFFQLPLIIVICIVFFCIWISISIFIKNYNLCLSNHNLEIPGPICLKFGLGNSGDPQECFSLVLVF